MTPRPISELVVRALTDPAYSHQRRELWKLVRAAKISDQTLRNWRNGMRPQDRYHRILTRILGLGNDEFDACLAEGLKRRPRKQYDTSNRPKKEKT